MKQGFMLALTVVFFIQSEIPLFSQETITVKAGTKIIDYFPPAERYRYSAFTPGMVVFKDNTFTSAMFNYSILSGEMEFIQKGDTLAIANPDQIKMVVLATDTFFYYKGYLEVLYRVDNKKLLVKQFVETIGVAKQSAYGTTSSTSAISSFNTVGSSGRFYKLLVAEDVILRKARVYYLYTPENGFVLFRKNAVIEAFPGHEDRIRQYLKEQKVDFNDQVDLINLMKFTGGI